MTDRRTMVFEAIRSILETSSIDDLTIVNIAEKCHLHPNTVNYYFNGKTDMLMRFHAYLSDVSKAQLPPYYFQVPADTSEAVKALVSIVDMEIYEADMAPPIRLKLHNHLLGMMHQQPQVRYYYAQRHYAGLKFLQQTFERYAQAGIVNRSHLEEGFSSIHLVSAGNTMLRYYYDYKPMEINMSYERIRILKMMLLPQHHPLLMQMLSEPDANT